MPGAMRVRPIRTSNSSTPGRTRSRRKCRPRCEAMRAGQVCPGAIGKQSRSAMGRRLASNGSPTEPKPSAPWGWRSRRCRGRTARRKGFAMTDEDRDGDAVRMERALHPELVKRCRGIEGDDPDALETLGGVANVML